LKSISILSSFVLVPITLNYLDKEKYGLWLTISSLIGWFNFFDIGLGNGLRNKLAEAFAVKDYKLGKIYISTTYFLLCIIILILYILFIVINNFVNWSLLLNTGAELNEQLRIVAIIVFTFFSLSFILKLIGVIFIADQYSAVNDSFNTFSSLISLSVIYFLTKITSGNLVYISIIYSASPVIVLIIASIYSFNKKYPLLKPSIKSIKIKYSKELAGLGVKFFILQIAVVIIFSTDNLIITQILGPSEVTIYNIAFKYFSIATMGFTIVMTPFWSAFTEAYIKKEFDWIKKSVKNILRIWMLLVIGILFLLLFSDTFYGIWVGDNIKIPFLLSTFMAFFAVISTWNNIFVFFINGIGKIKLQVLLSSFGMIINIPLSIFFAKNLGMGSAGVILGTCLTLSLGAITSPLQYMKIINGNAQGIWFK